MDVQDKGDSSISPPYENDATFESNRNFQYKNNCSSISNIQKRINSFLVLSFENLGEVVAIRWKYFVIFPLFVGCLATFNLRNVKFLDDLESLSLPVEGRWAYEHKTAKRLFHDKEAQYFDPSRLTSPIHYVHLIVKSKHGRNILNPDIWRDIEHLGEVIVRKTFKFKEKILRFEDICASWQGECFSQMLPLSPDGISALGSLLNTISFAANLSPLNYISSLNFYLDLVLGKPEFDEEGVITRAEALSMYFWLRSDTQQDIERASVWEQEILHFVKNASLPRLQVSSFAARTPKDEMRIGNARMRPLLAVSGVLMVAFASLSALMRDQVQSKVLLSVAGIVSAVLGTSTAFSILLACGVPFIGINYAAVFLMLGIGIDDMFVFVAAWRRTSTVAPVIQRMRTTFGHACVSVTVTSLTNVTAFSIGIATSIRAINIFSAYSCLSAFFTYIFFMTFFGGVMAGFGYLEENRRHSLLCYKIGRKDDAEEPISNRRRINSWTSNSAPEETPPEKIEGHAGMLFVSDVFGYLLTNSYCKGMICFSYVVYVVVIVVGLVSLKQEIDPNRVFFQTSTSEYFNEYDQYFAHKPSFAQVIFTKNLDYGNSEVEQKILKLHDRLEALPFIRKNLTSSWIRDWYKRGGKTSSLENILYDNINMNKARMENATNLECSNLLHRFTTMPLGKLFSKSGEKEVLNVLEQILPCNAHELLSKIFPEKFLEKHHVVLKIFDFILWMNTYIMRSMNFYEMDINVNPIDKTVDSSRVLMVVENANKAGVQRQLRHEVDKSGLPGTIIFNFQAFLVSQAQLIRQTTIFSITATVFVVLLVCFALIPSIQCSIWVAFSIVSIELGVISLMALWDVKLNAVSMVNLIMCVGFSVDFSAHISYAYLTSKAHDPGSRTRDAMYSVGLPILLGGLSTITGIIPICFSDSQIFITFFKIVFLVILLGMLHALIYLPFFINVSEIKWTPWSYYQKRISEWFESRKSFDKNKNTAFMETAEVLELPNSSSDTYAVEPCQREKSKVIYSREEYLTDDIDLSSDDPLQVFQEDPNCVNKLKGISDKSVNNDDEVLILNSGISDNKRTDIKTEKADADLQSQCEVTISRCETSEV